MPNPSLGSSILLCFALACSAGASAQPSSPEAVVRSFHEALRVGNINKVKELLAQDATVLESGHAESRDEYLSHHLAADIEFAKAVPSKLLSSQTTVNGATAWVRSSSESSGTFRNRPIKLVGAELVVLTQAGTSWEIRAIHWSSQKSK